MNCEKTLEEISSYIDGELSPENRVDLVRHLSGCSRCREEHVEVERAKAALAAGARKEMPKAVRSHIKGLISETEPAQESVWLRMPRLFQLGPRWALAGAAAALLVIVSTINMQKPEEPKVSLKVLLSEHVRSSRKSADIHRGVLAAAPYD